MQNSTIFFIDFIDENRFITSCECLYKVEPFIFNGFLISANNLPYLCIGWFCKIVYHFKTTNKTIHASTGKAYSFYKTLSFPRESFACWEYPNPTLKLKFISLNPLNKCCFILAVISRFPVKVQSTFFFRTC